ncbi:MAG: protein BatD, partial [bacterium]|nr:protein BatD [bacterium]
TIPPAKYQHQGKSYQTKALKVEVIKGSMANSRTNRRRNNFSSFFDNEDDFFNSRNRSRQAQQVDVKLQAKVSKTKVLQGEQVIYRVLLVTRNRIQSVNMMSNQSIPGFWQEWAPVSRSISPENQNINGVIYQVYEIRKAALFPTRTGKVTIPAMKFRMGLVDTTTFFSNTRNIDRSTPAITLDVSPVPAEAQGLPIGQFTMSLKPDKKKVDINDILTAKLFIRAI